MITTSRQQNNEDGDRDFSSGEITFHADLPKDVFDKILGNTEEDMRRFMTPGNHFDLYDSKGDHVVYVAIPPEMKDKTYVSLDSVLYALFVFQMNYMGNMRVADKVIQDIRKYFIDLYPEQK